MSKIDGLYHCYKAEREEELRNYLTGGDTLKDFEEFLKTKLNADDYFTAQEMLTKLMAETEKKGFTAGCKYTSGLAKELFTE